MREIPHLLRVFTVDSRVDFGGKSKNVKKISKKKPYPAGYIVY